MIFDQNEQKNKRQLVELDMELDLVLIFRIDLHK